MIGKRKSYINPFTLYIFISFLAFFMPHILPQPTKAPSDNEKVENEFKLKLAVKDSLINTEKKEKYTAVSLDSIYKSLPQEDQIINSDGLIYNTSLNIIENVQHKEKNRKAFEFFINNLPKALFFYMPLFAFMLWLFHNKKKYYYFDNGIFTLHFFSVVLMSITVGSILACIANWLDWTWLTILTWLFFTFYVTFYFIKGSRVFYAEKRWVSNTKSFLQIIINFVLILFVFIFYILFTVVKVYG